MSYLNGIVSHNGVLLYFYALVKVHVYANHLVAHYILSCLLLDPFLIIKLPFFSSSFLYFLRNDQTVLTFTSIFLDGGHKLCLALVKIRAN